MEKLSKKRGRPRTWRREVADSMDAGESFPSCSRTRMSLVLAESFKQVVNEADEEIREAITGSREPIGISIPSGCKTAFAEFGRWIKENGEQYGQSLAREIAKRCQEGQRLTEVANDFRTQRVGASKGSYNAYYKALVRAHTTYVNLNRDFDSSLIAPLALRHLADQLEEKDDSAGATP